MIALARQAPVWRFSGGMAGPPGAMLDRDSIRARVGAAAAPDHLEALMDALDEGAAIAINAQLKRKAPSRGEE